ncbi:MAG: succinyl-diaminopimelate desuccinylase [Bdellovibrionaceae bacterium]|nr:succinyl-diaminopimelate desuccinylase [Pseudobdellovibrionaceae bacterium]
MSFIEDCRQIIGLDSTPGQGCLSVAEKLRSFAEEAGFHCDFYGENQQGLPQANLLIRPKSSNRKKELLLQTHMDTVEPGNYGSWTRTQANPFQVNVYGDEMYGLGVADVKLDFMCKLEAAKSFAHEKNFKSPFVLAATYGAQTGMNGAIRLMRKKLIDADRALIGEPTGLKVCASGMGLATVDIFVPFGDQERAYRESHDLMESSSTQSKLFHGKAAHSSNPDSGENAIFKALDYLEQLPTGLAIMDFDGGINDNSVPPQAFLEVDFVGDLKAPTAQKLIRIHKVIGQLREKMREERDHRFEPNHSTLNLGTIRTTSDGVYISGSCRIPPSVDDGVYRSWMNEMGQVCAEVGGRFSVRDYRRGFDSSKSDFAKEVCDLAGMKAPLAIPTTTEASVFSKMGIACVVYGAGESLGNSHQPNEMVRVSELNRSIEFYRSCIERFCL